MLTELKHWDDMLHHARAGDYDKAAESELKYHEERAKKNPYATKERPRIPTSEFGRKRHYDIYLKMDNTHKQVKIKEDAPANCAGGGAVAAIGVGQQGEPPKKAMKRFKEFKR